MHGERRRCGHRARRRGRILGLGCATPSSQTFIVASLFLKSVHSLCWRDKKSVWAKKSPLQETFSSLSYFPFVCQLTCLRNLLAIRVSGETSDWLQVGQTWSSESSRVVRIPEQEI